MTGMIAVTEGPVELPEETAEDPAVEEAGGTMVVTEETTGAIGVTEDPAELPDQTAEEPVPDEPECEELGTDMLATKVILLQGPEENAL